MTFKMFNHRWGRDHSEAIQNWVWEPLNWGSWERAWLGEWGPAGSRGSGSPPAGPH